MAAALNTEVCEIYSDVDGVYSADPRICEQANHLSEITFKEMQAMSDAGAKVLNAQAVELRVAPILRSTLGGSLSKSGAVLPIRLLKKRLLIFERS